MNGTMSSILFRPMSIPRHVDRSPVGTDTFYALTMVLPAILFQIIRWCKDSDSGSPEKAERII